MFELVLLSASIALGQAPATYEQPATPASSLPTQPVTQQPGLAVYPPATVVQELGPVALDSEQASEGPSTLFMKAVDGTSLGTLLSATKTNISGFVDMRYTASNVNLNRLPAGMGFSFNPDVPQFNWVTINRAVDKESQEASFGYHIDTILYGSAYQFTAARGLLQSQLTQNNGGPNRYGIDIPQHYLEFYLPNIAKGMDVQVGRRFARFGVESLNSSQSLLPSYSYAFNYNPYTYTGVFTETKLTDKITVTNDFTTGPDVWLDDAASFFWLGAIQYDFTEKTNVRAATFLGNNSFDTAANLNKPAFADFVLNHKFGQNDEWLYTFEFLYGWQNNVPGIGNTDWYHFVNYLTYTWTDNLSTTARVEFFDDVDGQRTGTAGLYNSFTYGATWKPVDWFMFRPEVRYDRNNSSPFDGKKDFFAFTLNGILLW